MPSKRESDACTSDSFMVCNAGGSGARNLLQTAGVGACGCRASGRCRISGAPGSPHAASGKSTIWSPGAFRGADPDLPVLWIPPSAAAVGFRRRWTEFAARLGRMYVARHGPPEVIHAQSALFAGEAARELAEELGVPYVLMEHSSAYLRGSLTPLQTASTNRAVGAAGAVVAVSKTLKAALQRITDRETIDVIPNVVDTSRFAPPAYPRDQRTFRFVCVAMLGPHKNVRLLLRAFDRAFSGADHVLLDIVGDGSERRRLEKVVGEMQQRASGQLPGVPRHRRRRESTRTVALLRVLQRRRDLRGDADRGPGRRTTCDRHAIRGSARHCYTRVRPPRSGGRRACFS